MPKNKENSSFQIKTTIIDFVAIDEKRKRICVSSIEDNLKAININGVWQEGYPDIDDLLDYYSELKDLEEVNNYTIEARLSLQNLSE